MKNIMRAALSLFLAVSYAPLQAQKMLADSAVVKAIADTIVKDAAMEDASAEKDVAKVVVTDASISKGSTKEAAIDAIEEIAETEPVHPEHTVVSTIDYPGYVIPVGHGRNHGERSKRRTRGRKRFVWKHFAELEAPEGSEAGTASSPPMLQERPMCGFALPQKGNWVVRFTATAHGGGDLQIGLGVSTGAVQRHKYHIIVGGWDNKRVGMRVNVNDRKSTKASKRRLKLRYEKGADQYPDGHPAKEAGHIIKPGRKTEYTLSFVCNTLTLSYKDPDNPDSPDYELLKETNPHWIEYFGSIANMETISFSNHQNKVTVHEVSVSDVKTDRYTFPKNHGLSKEKGNQMFVWDRTRQEHGIRGYELPVSGRWIATFDAVVRGSDFNIGLSEQTSGTDGYDYRFIIGGWKNKQSALRRRGSEHHNVWQQHVKHYARGHYIHDNRHVIPFGKQITYTIRCDDGELKISYTIDGVQYTIATIDTPSIVSDSTEGKTTLPGIAKMRTISFSNYRSTIDLVDASMQIHDLGTEGEAAVASASIVVATDPAPSADTVVEESIEDAPSAEVA